LGIPVVNTSKLTRKRVDAAELPALISSNYDALARLASPHVAEATAPARVQAVSIRKSQT
jgi:predicted transcriptional regulator